MRKPIIWSILALVVVVVAALGVLYFMMGKIVRSGIEVIGPDATGTSVSVANVDIGLASGKAGLSNLVIGNPKGFSSEKAFSMNAFKLDVDLGTVTKDVVVVESILIDGAAITWEGLKGDNHKKIMDNINKYAARFKEEGATEKDKAAKKPQKKVIIDDFLLSNSTIDFVVADKKIATIPLPDLHLKDIGRKEGGKTVSETIQQTYQQVLNNLGNAIDKNRTMLTQKLSEVEQKGKELLEKGKDAIREKGNLLDTGKEDLSKTVDTTKQQLEGIKKGVGDLFKKK